jgi:hypothetical protein
MVASRKNFKRRLFMTDTNTQTVTGKKPSLIAYHEHDSANGEGFFTRIGASVAEQERQRLQHPA